jgi:hypothetical protein
MEVLDTGVTVFREKRATMPPPVPEKPSKMAQCRHDTCVSPLDHVSPVDYSELEKGDLIQVAKAERNVEGTALGRVEQSPHLGHRSPGWQKRQSVISYISTGRWSQHEKRRWIWSVTVGAGIVVIVIIGLLAGLLSRR